MIRFIRDRIEWQRMKMIAFDHPYFDIRAHRLSERKAERIIRKHQVRDVKEVIRIARIECGIPEPEESESSHAPIIDRRRDMRASSTFRFRRAIIAFVAAVTFIGFFTLTKPGVAFAQEIYKVVVRIFDGTLMARNNKMPDEISPIDFSKLPAEYSTLEEAAEATGRAIVVPDSNDSTLVEFFTDTIDNEMMLVSAKYLRGDGKSYRIAQTIHNKNSLWAGAASTIDDDLASTELSIGVTIYFGEMTDGTVYAEAYGAGFDLNLSSTELSLKELQEVVLGAQIIK